jgi:hypothetical protein
MPGGLALASNPLGLVPVATAQHQLAWPRIGVTTACLRELIIGILNPLLPRPHISQLSTRLVGSAPHQCYCCLPGRIDYLNIESIVASAPHQLAQRWIGWVGPALVLPPLASEH